jgi:hypothetical protein
MFYKEDSISKLTKCEICKEVYEDPRILPCGASACQKCIAKLNNEFECFSCKEKHTLPVSDKGFPVNQTVLKLLEEKPGYVYRNKNVEELKAKLAELKIQGGKLKFGYDNGIDQIREHYILLRNRVHLQTDILIEEIHQNNEKLIGEINKYEEECIESFKNKKSTTDYSKMFNQINKFYQNTLDYLAEFEIDERQIAYSLFESKEELKRLSKEENSLRKVKFGGNKMQMMQFKKNTIKPEQSLLGSLIYKPLEIELANFKETLFKKNIAPDCVLVYYFFKSENGFNYLLYYGNEAAIVVFDDNGTIISRQGLGCSPSGIVNLRNGFIFSINGSFYGNSKIKFLNKAVECKPGRNVSIITDLDFNFITSQNFDYDFSFLRANKSNIVCIDCDYNFYFCDLKLNQIPGKSMSKIKEKVEKQVINFEMNDQFLFFLCTTDKLKIFDVDSFDLVKEIDTNANRIKLVSTDYLLLFDSSTRIGYFYQQERDFDKLDEIDFANLIEKGFRLSERDKTEFISFYDSTSIKYTVVNMKAVSS